MQIKIENPLIGGWECKENCECIGLQEGDKIYGNEGRAGLARWLSERNNLCISLGDCGSKENYIGTEGYQAKDPVTISKDIGE